MSSNDSDDEDYSPVDVSVSSVGLHKGEVIFSQRQTCESSALEKEGGEGRGEFSVDVTPGCTVLPQKGPEKTWNEVNERPEAIFLSQNRTPGGPTLDSTSSCGHRIRLHALKGSVRVVCLSPQGNILCAGGDSGEFAMWDFDRPPENWRVSPTRILTPFVNRITGLQAIIAAHASLDGSYFVVCQDGDRPALVSSGGAQLGFCAMGERGLLTAVQCKGHRAPVTDSSPHGSSGAKFLTASQDGTGRVWDSQRFTAHSLYAVQHGSGQLDEHVVVECICGLSGSLCGGGESFLTGGQDGLVQLWDTRLKYRPGGAVCTWDTCGSEKDATLLRSSPSGLNRTSSRVAPPRHTAPLSSNIFAASTMALMAEEKHVGGMAAGLSLFSTSATEDNTQDTSEEYKASGMPVVVIRVGERLHTIDLRQGSSSRVLSSTSTSRAHTAEKQSSTGSRSMLLHQNRSCTFYSTTPLSWMPAIPFVGDTTKVATCSGSPSWFFTGTTRKGFENIVGGHVVQWQAPSLSPSISSAQYSSKEETKCFSSWCAGRPSEDVLCVAADPVTWNSESLAAKGFSGSVGGGALFAGLSSGEVAVRFPLSSLRSICPFARWWDSRPSAASAQHNKKSDRQVGQKGWRDDDTIGLF